MMIRNYKSKTVLVVQSLLSGELPPPTSHSPGVAPQEQSFFYFPLEREGN